MPRRRRAVALRHARVGRSRSSPAASRSSSPTRPTTRSIYTSHEGTTHLYQPGLVSGATLEFAADYRNQVNLWTSTRQRLDVDAATTSAAVRVTPGVEHRVLRPRPHPGRRRPDLQHGHRPGQRRAVLEHRRRAASGTAARSQCTRATARGWPAEEGRGVPGDEHVAQRSPDLPLDRRRPDVPGQRDPRRGRRQRGALLRGNGKLLYDRTRDALASR